MVRFTAILGPADGAVLVTCRGEIDLATVDRLAEALDAAMLAAPNSDVIVDFTDVDFFDALTIGTLVDANNRLQSSRNRLALRGLNAFQRQVFRISGTDRLVMGRETATPGREHQKLHTCR